MVGAETGTTRVWPAKNAKCTYSQCLKPEKEASRWANQQRRTSRGTTKEGEQKNGRAN